MGKNSAIEKFYEKDISERLECVREFAELEESELEELKKISENAVEKADRMSENVIGTTFLPLGIATNFIINGKEYLVPMATEEPSVVAAASKGAKLCRESGGFKAESSAQIMIGQIQLCNVKNLKRAKKKILSKKSGLIKKANNEDKILVKLGGGAKKIELKVFRKERMVVVYLFVDVKDAMGANAVNTMAEAIAPELEELGNGIAVLRIISNLATERKAKATAIWKKEVLGDELIERIILAYKLAELDVYRACTHNKGIMNGIDAVAIATGNDFRAIEAGAHAYASHSRKYRPLTKYHKDKHGNLVGMLEMPLAVGIVGGATKTNPVAKISIKILGVKSAAELAEVMASVGLAQNFAALRALASEGIQKGHMKLHAKNIAITAGAKGHEIEKVAEKMAESGNVKVDFAEEILKEIRNK